VFYVLGLCGVANGYFEVFTLERLFLATVAGLTVVWLHKEDIVRLLNGEEKKFTFKK
jgi:glycerol-3-phosphate acyltransferase PlsY